MEEKDIVTDLIIGEIDKVDFTRAEKDKILLQLGDYEIKEECGEFYVVKKDQREGLFVARDIDGSLWLYNYEPVREGDRFNCAAMENGVWSEGYELDRKLFPELTFEASPKKVKLMIV